MSGLRLSALREKLRTALWFWPAIAVTLAIVVGTVLPMLEEAALGATPGFGGSPDGARAVLSTVAGSTITVTGLTFSMTVVALQMASSQFTPRLMGTFLADRGNQAVLSVFLGTFAWTLAVLRSVRSAREGSGPFVPDISMAISLVLTVLSVAMLVYFFHHLTQQLRVESMLEEVQRDTLALVRRVPVRDPEAEPPEVPTVPKDATPLRALRSGYLQAVDIDRLLQTAVDHDQVVHLRPSVGTHVTKGTTLAWVFPVATDAKETDDETLDLDGLTRQVHHGIHLGGERTLQQDVAFGVRQLVDIAARALSPGINDPATAVAALGALAPVIVELVGKNLDALVGADEDGRVRAISPRPSFSEILALACDQPRRYGRAEPAVLVELLSLLTDVAEVDPDARERDAVRSQIAATAEAAEPTRLNEAELARVTTWARHARAALNRGHRVATVTADSEEPAS